MNPLAPLTANLVQGHELSRDDIYAAVEALLDPTLTDDDKAGFLTALAQKGETPSEIAGFAGELRSRAIDPGLEPSRHNHIILDVCGTGADMAHTFNISTCVTFVAAAAGIAVAKHGNRAITSQSGSADVLAALGANIELAPPKARRCLEQTGVAFFFAPAYHPAFKTIAPVRKKLAERKQRTVFNILGPLVNPARPTHQVVGLFDPHRVTIYAEVLRLLGLKSALVVHGDGLDELTTTGPNLAALLRHNQVAGIEVLPAKLGIKPAAKEDLAGGDPAHNAQITRDILTGSDRGPRRDIVLLNAAAALYVTGHAGTWAQGIIQAGTLIDSGKALDRLDRFVQASRQD
jgi:anthranilate phosphoribosyltransferase